MMMRSGSPPAIGRTARSSKTAPMAAVAAIAATAASGKRQPEAREEHAEHAAEHEELALREVDRAGRRVHDREAERHERVDRAVLQARYEELQQLVQGVRPTYRLGSWTRRSARRARRSLERVTHLPPLISYSARSSSVRPLWSVGEKVKVPPMPTKPLVFSIASRSAAASASPPARLSASATSVTAS